MALATLEDEHMGHVVDGLRGFYHELARRQHGATTPLRAFVVPCAQVI
jgi:hypothetical protein